MSVWVLIVEHRHGTNTSVHRTEDGARNALDEYVSDYWHELVGSPEVPEDRDARIELYFNRHGEEFYSLSLCGVED